MPIMNIIKKRIQKIRSVLVGKFQIDDVFQICIPNLHIKHNKHNTHSLAFIILDYEDIMDNIMKTLCVFGIPNQHNIHTLKNRQICSSAVAQANVHNLPNTHKEPNQHIIYLTCAIQVAPLWCSLGCRSESDGRIHQ